MPVCLPSKAAHSLLLPIMATPISTRDEFMGWVAESGLPKDSNAYGAAHALLKNVESPGQELAIKHARNYGTQGEFLSQASDKRLHQHFGFLLLSCDRADLRPMPGGIAIYGDKERRFDPLPPPTTPRAEVIDEFHAAVVTGRPPVHDGTWGLATMETCLAMLLSAREQRDVRLNR